MESVFKITRKSRELYLDFLERYSLAQLNTIPPGFNNNLIWNIGHVIVSQQLMVYRLSGNEMMVNDGLINLYRRGTKPDRDITQGEVDELKKLLFSTIQKTEEDYRNGLFTTYNEFKSEFGFVLANIDDALTFNNYHEGVHLGAMMGLRKFI